MILSDSNLLQSSYGKALKNNSFKMLKFILQFTVLVWVFTSSTSVFSQQIYSTPWFEFDLADGWIRIDKGELLPKLPSIYSKAYEGYQANVGIYFGEDDSPLSELSVTKKETLKTLLPNHLVIADRFFTTDHGFPAHEYYVSSNGNRFRYIDVIVSDGEAKFSGSFWGLCPLTDSTFTTDRQILEMLHSVRPVIDPPIIIEQPLSASGQIGNKIELSIDYTSDALQNTIQWFHNGRLLGLNSKTLVLDNFVESMQGDYWATVTSFAGSVTSSKASVIVESFSPIPKIIRHPISMTVVSGQPIYLSVTAEGEGDLTYSWTKNGQKLLGQNRSFFEVPNSADGDSGEYSVTVKNKSGTTTSLPAIVNVLGNDSSSDLTFFVENVIVSTSEERATVPIKVLGFNNIGAYQFTLSWNPNLLKFVDLKESNGSLIHNGTNGYEISNQLTGTGKLTLVYVNPAFTDRTIDDNSILLELDFELLTDIDAQRVVRFDNHPTEQRVASFSGPKPTFQMIDGYVQMRLTTNFVSNSPKLSIAGLSKVVQLHFESELGEQYLIEGSDDLSNWAPDGPLIIGNGEQIQILRMNDKQRKFYRVTIQ